MQDLQNTCNYLIQRKLLVVVCMLFSVQLFAHGDLSKRILQKTQEIQKSPNNFELYYDRGLLYQQHEEYVNALKDYYKSEFLGNSNRVLHYRIAETHYLNKEYNKAEKAIQLYLAVNSVDVKAKKLEAQIYFHLEAYKKALNAYSYVMIICWIFDQKMC